MCPRPETPKAPTPAPPPEVLDQPAPVKKTADEMGKARNPLAIGTKKYRNTTGLGSATTKPVKKPSGID